MDSWRTIGGVDWLCPGEIAERPASAQVGVAVAHGYAHETPSELGIGAAAAMALARELARPRETSDHRVVQAQVATEVGLQHTALMLTGDHEAVRLAAVALDAMLLEPQTLEVTDRPDTLSYAWSGWTNELTAWIGMGPGVLATEIEDPWRGRPQRLHEFVRTLHPGQGRQAVAWTTDPDLVGAVFTQGPGPRSAPEPVVTWCDPAPTASGHACISATFDNNLLSVRLPTSYADDLAMRLVGRTLHRNLVPFAQVVADLQFVWEPIGSDMLFAVRATPYERTFDPAAVHQAMIQALEASVSYADPVLEEELARAISPDSLDHDLRPAGRALDALRSGTRVTSGELLAGLSGLHPGDIRDGLERVHRGLLLGMPQGVIRTPNRRLIRPAVLPPLPKPYLHRRAVVPFRSSTGFNRQYVRATTASVEQTVKPVWTLGNRAGQRPTSAVDLRHLVARVDLGDTWTTLIDRRDRRVTLAWPTYRRPAPLRSLVDAATPPAIRMTVAADPARVLELRRRIRRWHVGLVAQLLVCVAIIVLLGWHPATGKPYQKPLVRTVAMGQTATLGNGSTVQVSAAEWRSQASRTDHYLVADVHQCGGGATVDRKAPGNERNWVLLEHFSLTGVTQPSERVVPLSAGDEPLAAFELSQGQCSAGKIGFILHAAELPPQPRIQYRNDAGDDVTWTFR